MTLAVFPILLFLFESHQYFLKTLFDFDNSDQIAKIIHHRIVFLPGL